MIGAIEFLKAYHEFCKAQDCTVGCPLRDTCLMDGALRCSGHESEIVGIVMRWKGKHENVGGKKMVGAVEFMNHWKAICKEEKNCKGCPLEHSCDCETLPADFSSKRILALIGDVEKTRRKKKLGGYPEDGEA